MKKVLIVSTSLDEQKSLEEVGAIRSIERLQITTTASFGQESGWWKLNVFDCVLIHLPPEEYLELAFLKKLKRDIPKQIPVIFLVELVSGELLSQSKERDKIRILKKPLAADFIYRTILELTTDFGPGKQQLHPRFPTNQQIEMNCEYKKIAIEGVMKNVSLGGAYVESSQRKARLVAGDLLKLKIRSSAGKSYELDAKLIWKSELPSMNGLGYGLSFVTMDGAFDRFMNGVSSDQTYK